MTQPLSARAEDGEDAAMLLRELANRANIKRQQDRLSYRQMGVATGVAFSTLARVIAGKGNFDRENERKVRIWLDEPVTHITPLNFRNRATELGRIIAQSCAAEIELIVIAAIAKTKEADDGSE